MSCLEKASFERMMYYVENKWKQNINRLKNQGIQDPRIWANEGGNDILNLNLTNFGVAETREELRLVTLFR